MLFDRCKVSFVDGGYMKIPRDNYAPRYITWGQFNLSNTTIWFFNTHLPHNHNQASSPRTHAKIARMLLKKRKELGAENAPTIVVGDMNSHASHFNKVEGGGFESNLQESGFTWAYTAKGGQICLRPCLRCLFWRNSKWRGKMRSCSRSQRDCTRDWVCCHQLLTEGIRPM